MYDYFCYPFIPAIEIISSIKVLIDDNLDMGKKSNY